MYYNSECLLLMKLISNTVQLPKISIRELEERVKCNYSRSPLSPTFHPNDPSNSDLKITSPFYHRLLHDSKCECQYHRLKRAERQNTKKITKQNQDILYRFKHLTHHDVSTQQNSTLRQMAGQQNRKTFNKYLKPLGNIVEEQRKANSVLQQVGKEQEKNGSLSNPYLSGENKSQRVNKMVEARKIHWTELSRIDAINSDYISLINDRFQNNQYKSDYLKNIFRFIRMKAKQDRHYIKESRAYLQNSLNVLLNHYSIGQLLKYDELDEDQLAKIAHSMGCKEHISKNALVDLKKVVDQMEGYLQKLKEKAKLQAENTDMAIFINEVIKTDLTSISNDNSEAARIITISSTNELQQDRSNQKIQKNNDCDFVTSKDRFMNLRKSKKGIIFESTSLVKSYDSLTNNSENKLRSSGRSSQVYDSSHSNTRSPRSTILGIVDEQESEHYKAKNKKNKVVKVRRVKPSPKPTILQFDQKYASIKYETYCSKDHFIKLISQIQRLDQNDSERAQIVFRMLLIQKFIDNEQKIAEMLETFSPLISEPVKVQLLKKIVVIKDQKLIEKLARQLDDMLTAIKRTDPRLPDAQELFPYKEDPILKKAPTRRIIHYKGDQVKRPSARNHIILYEAQQRVERHRNRQLTDKQELQQAELDEIKAQSLEPNLTQSIYHKQMPKKQPVYISKNEDCTSNKQKKVLQYMHKNHANTFNYLSNQITSLCKTLTQSDPKV